MAFRASFDPNFSLSNSSWYRERREEDWSPRSQESDHEPSFDSDEENHASKVITISDSSSGLSSLESSPLVPLSENSSFSRSTPSTSLVLHSRGNKLCLEDKMATSTRVDKEYVPKSSSLVIGKRSRAVGLKDIDLTRNLAAKHIRQAKEANKSPKKNHIFSPLSRHMSCPAFSYTNGSFMRPSCINGIAGKSGETDVNHDFTFEATSLFKSPLNDYSTTNVAGNAGPKTLRLFSCPDYETSSNEQCTTPEKVNKVLGEKLDSRKTPNVTPGISCLDSEFSMNTSGLGVVLKSELYGQHIAQKVIVSALKNHFSKRDVRKPLVFSFHGWTGIGKNFVSNIITEHLFKGKSQSPFVHKFIIPLHFPHESEADRYNKQLLGWIRGNVSNCRKGGLFIFDEMDKIHPGMMGAIKDAILDYRGKKASDGHQNIFIFLSNSGGRTINDHVLKHVLDGKLRETLTLSELEIIFQGITQHTPDIWFADLLKSEVFDHLVPFLPLERTHVKQCIRRDLVKKGFPVIDAIVTAIADQLEYFPPGYEFFSLSGCKKVSSRVDVIMG